MIASSPSISAKDTDAIRHLFSAGEAAKWFGQPEALRYARRYRACTWFGLWFVFLSVVMLAMAFTFIPAPLDLWLLSIAGIAAGVFLMFIPVLQRRRASHIVYVLTNQRALIVTVKNATARLSDSCELGTAKNFVGRATDNAGYGDIALNYNERETLDGVYPEGIIFLDIPAALEVKALVEELAASARRSN